MVVHVHCPLGDSILAARSGMIRIASSPACMTRWNEPTALIVCKWRTTSLAEVKLLQARNLWSCEAAFRSAYQSKSLYELSKYLDIDDLLRRKWDLRQWRLLHRFL